MRHQIHLFLTALMFFTRIPIPKIPYHSNMLQESARYFTWVGMLVGSITGLTFYLSSLVFSAEFSILLSMLSSIWVTGAFHEDGLADCFDAFGGGWKKEQILTIMKDSRLGTYGVIGLIASLSMKFLLLHELVHIVSLYLLPFILIAAHSISRGMAIVIMQTLTYVQDIDSSKSKPLANRQLTLSELVIASVGIILPLLILIEESNLQFELAISLIPVLMGALFLGRYWKKWIGGYTGDCLGATQQITELIFYFTVVLIWKFI